MAAEFVASAAANTVGNLATEYASPYLSFFFQNGKIVEDFKRQRNELELKIDRVKNDVEEALRQTEIIEKDVEDWLTRARKEVGEARSLEDEIERNKCFNWCPSWGWRYCLSKKIAKKTPVISNLLQTCNFSRIGRRAPLQGIEFLLTKDIMPSESSKLAFNRIMYALKGDGAKTIGLHGMPGVGKTTLMKVVLEQATQKKLFDKVVSVTVSQTPNFNEIRERIAELFGLEFKAKTEEGKAEELCRRLKSEKEILIILDDVWKEIELQTIGIPFGDEHEGCKILITTRLQHVCIQMNCEEIFELNILSDIEAWALFKDKAGLKDDSPTLDVAKEVARECSGLPLAIVTVAKALKGESLNMWIAANKRLKSSRHLDNQDVCGGIYRCLELSYDFLDQENIKSCFLLCSLFPEDYEISIDLLTICGIGQGLFDNNHFMEDLRREIHLALLKLQKSGLLLEANDKEHVKMHDVVRDFAHWITLRGENTFMVKEGLREWPMSKRFECCVAISLWNVQINNLPEKLEFSKLKTLLLTGETLLKVSSTFFQGMKTLRVLFLKHVALSVEALQFLTNLRTLCFINCELKEISLLRNMENLEILALLHSNIWKLPAELGGLRKLKSLYFSSHTAGDKFPSHLLSRLTSLQELHVTNINNDNLLELNSLSRLTGLTMRLSADQCSQENFVFPELKNYNIAVNEDLQLLEGLSLRTLRIRSFPSSLNAFNKLFCNVEKLMLKNIIMEHKNIVPNVDKRGLNELSSLELGHFGDLECLIDTTREQSLTTAFSNLVNLDMVGMTCLEELCQGESPISFLKMLETLKIDNCRKLKSVFQVNGLHRKEESQTRTISNLRSLELQSLPALEIIWKEPTHHVSLQSLKVVKVDDCDELRSIFSPCISQSLLHLEQLIISKCIKLEHVLAFDKQMDEQEVLAPLSYLKSLDLSRLPTLESIWKEPTHHVSLQSLKDVNVHDCDELKSIFSPCLAQRLLHLEQIEISRCHKLQQVFVFDKEMTELEVAPLSYLKSLELRRLPTLESIWKEPTHRVSLQSLKDVIIHDCDELKSIFLPCLSQSLLHLEQLKISRCHKLEQVFAFDKEMAKLEENQAPPLSNLSWLGLESLPELKWIWKGRSTRSVSLQSLKSAEISYCNRLIYLFSPSLAQSLVLLQQLKIHHCNELQHIITELDPNDEIESNSHFHSPLLPKLETLEISHCPSLKYVFQLPSAQLLPQLMSFSITNSPRLEQVFNGAKENDGVGRATVFPLLQDLQLGNLTNLSCFSSENFLISTPSLENIEVWECPRLSNFTVQKEVNKLVQLKVLSLSKLENGCQLRIIGKHSQEFIAVESHEAVLQVHGRIKELHLKDLSEVQIIWKDVAQAPTLENLKILKVIDCKRLRCVFPLGSARWLPKLEVLILKGNSKLEHVFELEDEAEAIAEKVMKFDRLRQLILQELPKIDDFCPREYHIVLPALWVLVVKECPKMTTGFFVDSKGYVHSKTETSQLVEKDTGKGKRKVDTKTISWNYLGRGAVLPPYIEE